MKEKPVLEYALRAHDDEPITNIEYLHQFGEVDSAQAPFLRCPVCRREVHGTRMHDRAHTPHFVHAEGERAPCPLVNSTLPPATFMTIYPYHVHLEHERRDEFAGQWQQHFCEIRRHAPGFSVERVTRTIAHADVLHMWSCPTLRQADLPYLLLALAAFIAENPGTAHSTWLRFLFDSSVTEIADLRRPNRIPPRFFRLRYRASQNSMFPNASHLLDWAEVRMTGDFLNRSGSPVTSSEAAKFEAFIAPGPQPHPNDEPMEGYLPRE